MLFLVYFGRNTYSATAYIEGVSRGICFSTIKRAKEFSRIPAMENINRLFFLFFVFCFYYFSHWFFFSRSKDPSLEEFYSCLFKLVTAHLVVDRSSHISRHQLLRRHIRYNCFSFSIPFSSSSDDILTTLNCRHNIYSI